MPLAKLLRLLFCYLFHYWWLCLFWTPTARKHCHGKSWQALIKINWENQKVHHSAGFGLNAALSDLTQQCLGGRWCAPNTCERTLMYNLGMRALLSLSVHLVGETNIIFTVTSNLRFVHWWWCVLFTWKVGARNLSWQQYPLWVGHTNGHICCCC